MTPVQVLPWLLVGTPLAAGVLLLAVAEQRTGAWANVAACVMTLLLALVLTGAALPGDPAIGPQAALAPDGLLRADGLGAWAALLTAVVGLTTAWHARACVNADVLVRRFAPARARLFHSGFQLAQGSVLAALLANGPGLAWLAMLGAAIALAGTLASTAAPFPARPVASSTAAARQALLAGAGLAPALLGTTVLTLAKVGATVGATAGAAEGVARWGSLTGAGQDTLPQLGFMLLLVGYGSLAGLAPLAPLRRSVPLDGASGVPEILATGLSNAALVLLLRTIGALGWHAGPGEVLTGIGAGLMACLGLLSLLLGAAALWRRPGHVHVGCWLGAAGAVQAGIVALAFALGGAAVPAGLLYMAAATLARAGAAACLGRAAQRRGSAELDALAGLHDVGRGAGILALLCLAAFAGLPPAGAASGLVLLGMEASRHSPLIAAALAGALLAAGWALLACGARFLLGAAPDGTEEDGRAHGDGRRPAPRTSGPAPGRWDLAGVWGHLVLLLALGLVPAPIAALVAHAAMGVR